MRRRSLLRRVAVGRARASIIGVYLHISLPHLYEAIRDFPKDESHAKKEDAGGAAPLVCVMTDGTGIPLRKECLKGAKGKDGRAKTREVKAAVIFRASTTSDSASSSPA